MTNQINEFTIIISQAILSKPLTNDLVKSILEKQRAIENKLPKDHSLLIINSDAIASVKHLLACILYAIKAFEQQNNLAKSLAAEIILYLSGYRQISKAFQEVGLTPETQNIAFVQITKDIMEPNSKDEESLVNFEHFLTELKIQSDSFSFDVDKLANTNEKKIMSNLGITEENISLIMTDNTNGYSRDKAIEKLAIEKSTLLNILK
ncbi:MAG TPA: KEOPS complex subunit Cgi121 [Candidatus Bathyarchaeia archaeon]|nr:KEOPS complex subunit Cgi121 [Candidatus Bathyarchaeia archaeon]